jgi:hypothetical protein
MESKILDRLPMHLGYADIAQINAAWARHPAGTLAICTKTWSPDDETIVLLFPDGVVHSFTPDDAAAAGIRRVCNIRSFLALCAFVVTM